MSRLRQRAKAVRTEGAARRQIRTPSSDSPSFRRYLWWCKRRNRTITRENYCHYWRVCLIWAPLWKLFDALIRPLARLIRPLVYLTVAAVAGCLTYGVLEFWQADGGFWYKVGKVALWTLGILWGVAGIVLAIWVLVPLIPEPDEPERMAPSLDQRSAWLRYVGVALTMPMFLAVSLLLVVILALFWAVDRRIVPRAFTWLCAAHFAGSKWFGWFRLAYLFPTTLVGLAFFYKWALAGVYFALGMTGLMLAFTGLSWWANRHQQRVREQHLEAVRRADLEQLDRLLRIKFTILHPRKAESAACFEVHYQAWLQRYRRYIEREHGVGAFEERFIHLYYFSWRYDRYLARQAQAAAVPEVTSVATSSRPSRFVRLLDVLVDGLFRAIDVAVDFLSLAWTAIVVKKWGICPLVTLPTLPEGNLRDSGPVLEG
jgi:hypothetical protein